MLFKVFFSIFSSVGHFCSAEQNRFVNFCTVLDEER